jgi:exodeoxyribonuclease-5
MAWTGEQEGALKAVDRWFRGPDRYTPFYLAGYAGTGKTTLAKHFASQVPGTVRFAAFTGKAASVLRDKGCPGATTLHSLIYNPVGNSNTKAIKELKAEIAEELTKKREINIPKLERLRKELKDIESKSRAMFELKDKYDAPHMKEASLIILDECSMIDEIIAKDILTFNTPVLVLGDPGQLPPVKGKGAWTNSKPDYMLTEIHRQAQDSNIIKLAHEVRKGIFPTMREYEDCIIRPKADFDWDLALEADQVLTGMNSTRHKLNKRLRKLKGYEKLYPLAGDKLICLRNDHEEGLLNGVSCKAISDAEKVGATLGLKIEYENEESHYFCDPGPFEETYYGKRLSFPNLDAVEHFAYGYAITGHKSQGSQWPTVLICDDRMRSNDISMRKKWLYTVITRAEKKLILYS